jgi:hypothetical protein
MRPPDTDTEAQTVGTTPAIVFSGGGTGGKV